MPITNPDIKDMAALMNGILGRISVRNPATDITVAPTSIGLSAASASAYLLNKKYIIAATANAYGHRSRMSSVGLLEGAGFFAAGFCCCGFFAHLEIGFEEIELEIDGGAPKSLCVEHSLVAGCFLLGRQNVEEKGKALGVFAPGGALLVIGDALEPPHVFS